MALSPIVVGGFLAAIAAAALSRRDTPAAAPGPSPLPGAPPPAPVPAAKPGAQRQPPPDLLEKIKGAFLSADPGQARAVAVEAEAQGFSAQAADLRAYAQTLDAAIAAARATGVAPVPSAVPVPPIALSPPAPAAPPPPPPPPGPPPIAARTPGVMPPIAPPPPVAAPAPAPAPVRAPAPAPAPPIAQVDPQRELAAKTALHLRHAKKWKEDRELVTRFQAANQPEAGMADGLYGPKSATVLARKYGIVPPPPFYWPKKNPVGAQSEYKIELLSIAQVDKPREEEWRAAAAAATLYG